jgi:hypothetical protein
VNALERLAIVISCAVAFVAVEGRASAINGGVSSRRIGSHIAMRSVYQNPGVSWTFTTSNLVGVPGGATPDTVINVQSGDDPEGTFIAGNDDYNHGYDSSVTVPATSTSRQLVVIVRPYGPGTSGSCTLTATPSAGQGGFSVTLNFGGTFLQVGDLPVGSHIATSETGQGTNDSLIMAFSTDPTHAMGYDDDDGVDRMSSVRLKESCPSCTILFGLYYDVPDSLMNVVWDADVATNDADGDGLGIGLENFLGTSSSTALARGGGKLGLDTDQDGATDSEEVFGVETSGAPVKYPLMGANPKEKDVFVEIDWVKCAGVTCSQGMTGHEDDAQFPRPEIGGNPTVPGRCFNGSGPAILNETFAKATDRIVDLLEDAYAPVHLHLDTGLDNPSTSTWMNWGNWGGAERNEDVTLTQQTPGLTGYEGLTPGREHRFIHVLTFNTSGGDRGGGWTGAVPGGAFVGFPNYATFRHELGHALGLNHGGEPMYGGINFKASYVSPMSYLFDDYELPLLVPTFSHGTSLSGPLNPTKLDETKGIGNPPDANMLAAIKQYWCPVGQTCVTSTGSVDWNLDGVISPSSTLVRAPASLVNYPVLGRSVLEPNAMAPKNFLASPSLGYAAAGSAGERLWVVGRDSVSNQLGFFVFTKAGLGVCDGSFDNIAEDGPINCLGALAAPTAPTGAARLSKFAPAITELTPSPGPTGQPEGFLVVWQPPTGALQASVVTLHPLTGAPTWNATITLPGNFTATDDVAAVTTAPGVVKVYAPVGGRLKSWTFNNPTGFSSTVTDQKFEDNSLIAPKFGISVTRGFVDSQTTATSYAAIVTSTGDVEFVNETSTGIWKRLSTSWTTNVPKPKSLTRAGLAWVKTTSNTVGRFYMSYTRPSCFGPAGETGLILTEGQSTSGSNRRLQWKEAFIPFANSQGAVALLGDARDNHLRATMTTLQGQLYVMPLADGIVNTNMKDVDDYVYLQGDIRAALGLEAPLPF